MPNPFAGNDATGAVRDWWTKEDNDRFVALDLLKNAAIAAGGVLPMCQDTGTAIVMGKRGQGLSDVVLGVVLVNRRAMY